MESEKYGSLNHGDCSAGIEAASVFKKNLDSKIKEMHVDPKNTFCKFPEMHPKNLKVQSPENEKCVF